jgi:hypothetical protein
MNTRLVAALTVATVLAVVGQSSAESTPSSVTGHVIAKACAKQYGQHKFWGDEWRLDAGTAQRAVDCSAARIAASAGGTDETSDLGMVIDGAFYEFDKKGQTLAKVKLGNTTNPAAAVFTVTGRVIKSDRWLDSDDSGLGHQDSYDAPNQKSNASRKRGN